MIRKTHILFLLLILFSISIFSSSLFLSENYLKTIEFEQIEAKDSTFINKLQTFLDTYSVMCNTKDSVIEKLINDSLLLSITNKEIKKLNNEIAAFQSKLREYEVGHKSDSLAVDSIEIADDYKNSIILINKKIAAHEKTSIHLNDNFQHTRIHIKNVTDSINKLIKQIQPFIFKIKNGCKIQIRGIDYLIFMADLDNHEIRTHLYFPKSKKNLYQLEDVVKLLESQEANPLMVTNAGMFTTSYTPEGLYIEDGNPLFPIDTAGSVSDANFYLKPNGVFYIDSVNIPHVISTEEYIKKFQTKDVKNKCATQSGPLLVIDGAIHHSFVYGSNNAKIRSGVGVLNNKKVLFAITLDESNFYNFATLFKDLANCKNALFLDGAISKMYVKNLNESDISGSFGPMISISKKK